MIAQVLEIPNRIILNFRSWNDTRRNGKLLKSGRAKTTS